MGEYNAFGLTHGPGSVDNRRRIAAAPQGDRAIEIRLDFRRSPTTESDKVLKGQHTCRQRNLGRRIKHDNGPEVRQLVSYPKNTLEEVRVGHKYRPRPAVPEDVAHLGRGERAVNGHNYTPGGVNGEIREYPL